MDNAQQPPENSQDSDNGFTVQSPSLSLPKGGGAIRGIGEKYSTNPVTGSGSMSVPIATSPGRSGFGPQLTLNYDSSTGNGPFGFGWSLSIPAIARKTDKGLPRYDDAHESDVFILSGSEDLVPLLVETKTGVWGHAAITTRVVNGQTYHVRRFVPRVEGLFATTEQWRNTTNCGDVFWRVISALNVTTWYGRTRESRVVDPADGSRIFGWLISESYDDKGNVIEYQYKSEDSSNLQAEQSVCERHRSDESRSAQRYLKRVRYGNHRPYFPVLSADAAWPSASLNDTDDPAPWHFELVFDYGEHPLDTPTPNEVQAWNSRPDPFSAYRSGFEIRTYRLCRRALMFHHVVEDPDVGLNCLVRSTEFDYRLNDTQAIYTFLSSVSQKGFRRAEENYITRSMPPLTFEYSKSETNKEVCEIDPKSLENLPIGLDGTYYRWVDLHGEGTPGILTEQSESWFYKRNLSALGDSSPASPGDAHYVRFAPMEQVGSKPNASLKRGAALMDLAGDGLVDVVSLGGNSPGIYANDGMDGWLPFRPITSQLNRSFGDPNLRMIDIDGDGRADVLITEDCALLWSESDGANGFKATQRVAKALNEETGPRVIFADPAQSIYLADMSGDGLTDIVRIRNGDVCYWPNMGYGNFGAKVIMADAPWLDQLDQFDQRRIRLADIDGSGTADLIYLHRDGVRLYFNESGNGWSDPQHLPFLPSVDELANVAILDLFGNGTSCLVWSSRSPLHPRRSMRFIDLMGGTKPHLLVSTDNNLGAETRIHYSTSTKFYVQDKLSNRPWVTHLPFPVHVVERVDTYDHVSRNRFTTRFAYHHGYFDGVEREFRGFGMVEQWDTESFAALTVDDSVTSNGDAAFRVPPIHRKTWYHTGIYLDRERVSHLYAHDYFREPGLSDAEFREQLLPNTLLPDGLTFEEEREACRALKGTLLRQELYADDAGNGSNPDHVRRAHTPYSVTEQNVRVRLQQPRAKNRHAVMFVFPNESLSFHYERNPVDPRIQHGITLEVDHFGNVCKQVDIGYGRQISGTLPRKNQSGRSIPNPGIRNLLDADRLKQTTPLITYAQNAFTCAIDLLDAKRNPLICETINFELLEYVPTGCHGRYQRSDFISDCNESSPKHRQLFDELAIPFEKVIIGNRRRRCIQWQRMLYRSDDLTRLLPLGQIDSLALTGERYKLALTPGLISHIYQRKNDSGEMQPLIPDPHSVLAGQLGDQGGYLSSHALKSDGRFPANDPDDHWWFSSGRAYLISNLESGPDEELAYARSKFFLTRRYCDPFAKNTLVEFDSLNLLVAKTIDPLGNQVQAIVNDYRVLQPRMISDPNQNRTAVAYDSLGLVVGNAFMGKAQTKRPEGDSLENFYVDLSPSDIDALIDSPDPRSVSLRLIGNATSRIVYDLHRFARSRHTNPLSPSDWLPSVIATLTRETHVSDLQPGSSPKIQIGFSYSDGFQREVQRKLQAEPGRVDINVSASPLIPLRWVGSGWTIFNNKGNPVRQYEPFFSATHQFEFGVMVGVSPIMFYDAVDRVIATLYPNNTYNKVVFDPWSSTTYDVNDTCAPHDGNSDDDLAPISGDPRSDQDISGYVAGYFTTQSNHWETWFSARIRGELGNVERLAAIRSQAHANTPSTSVFDTLGRTFFTVERNRTICTNHTNDGVNERVERRIKLDIQGRVLEVRDAQKHAEEPHGRIVSRYFYDMSGRRIHHINMESGARWFLFDAMGKPIRVWDGRGHTFKTRYDALRRSIEQSVEGTSKYSDPRVLRREVLVDRVCYGESLPQSEHLNLRTRIFQTFDAAGISSNAKFGPTGDPISAFDFKGNLLNTTRQLVRSYKTVVDWNKSPELDKEAFESSLKFDALNRPIQIIAPHKSGSNNGVNVLQPSFNDAGFMERLEVWLENKDQPQALIDPSIYPPNHIGVANINYDAKGQRESIKYKNECTTIYRYDPKTFRLVQMETRRHIDADESSSHENDSGRADRNLLQDLQYTYDAVGNIIHIADASQQAIYFKNQCVNPSNDYIYDALYRLIQASGREHIGQGGLPIPSLRSDQGRQAEGQSKLSGRFAPGDGNAMAQYTERYVYDAVGNILQLLHRGTDRANAGWSRNYDYREESLLHSEVDVNTDSISNRLSSTTLNPNGNDPHPDRYSYDPHGNITSMSHLSNGSAEPSMQWDYRDQLHKIELGGGGTAFYVYDGKGQRIRKILEKAPGLTEERIYLGGFEIYRKHRGSINDECVELERETLHIMDDQRRIALFELRTIDVKECDKSPRKLVRYQIASHQGSSSIELDECARIISYEEYSPFGTTTYQSADRVTEVPKRYRYSGKERDSESGLYYHGARYYAPWIGRWTACDPGELRDGTNAYVYVRNNPVNKIDPNGKWDVSWKEVAIGAGLAVVGVAAIALTAGAAAPLVVPFVAGALGVSEAAVVTGAVVIGTTAGVVGSADTASEVMTGVDSTTGETLSDKDRSRRLGALPVQIIATFLGARGLGGGKPPTIPRPPSLAFLDTGTGFFEPALIPSEGVIPIPVSNIAVGSSAPAGMNAVASMMSGDNGGGGNRSVEPNKSYANEDGSESKGLELDDETRATLENSTSNSDNDIGPFKDPANKTYRGGLRPDDPVDDHLLCRAKGGSDTAANIDVKSLESNSVKGGREGGLLSYENYLRRNGMSEADIRAVTDPEWQSIKADVHAASTDESILNRVGDPMTAEDEGVCR